MSDAAKQIALVVEKYEEYKKLMETTTKELLSNVFKEFFEANPKAQCVSWKQYTPFFNDGEPCEFRLNEMYCYPYTEDGSVTFCEYDDELVSDENKQRTDLTSLQANWKELHKLLDNIPSDVYLAIFGDHADVTVSRSGIKIKECDHD